MKITLKVDWLTLTGKSDWGYFGAQEPSVMAAKSLAERIFDMVTDGDAVVRPDKPTRFYAYGFREVRSGLHISIAANLRQQGWMLRASGQTLNTPTRQKRLLTLAGTHGWNCSRLDFAVDVLDTPTKPAEIWTAWKIAHQGNMQKSCTLIESPSGDTFYLGSRSSEKMVRVYDKGKEQGVDTQWLRIEMEFKGDAASRAADAAQYNINNLVGPLQRFMDTAGHRVLDAVWLMADVTSPDGYWPLAEKPPRQRWFDTDVMSAMRKWATEDIDAVLEWMLRAHDEAVLAAEEERRRQFEEPLL